MEREKRSGDGGERSEKEERDYTENNVIQRRKRQVDLL